MVKIKVHISSLGRMEKCQSVGNKKAKKKKEEKQQKTVIASSC